VTRVNQKLPGGKIKDGTNFARDRRGNGFLHIPIEVADVPARALNEGVGIDLGLNDFAALSTGEKIANPRHFQQLENKLAKAQQAGHAEDTLTKRADGRGHDTSMRLAIATGWEVERSLTLKMTIGAAACVDWHVGQALPIHIGFPKLRLPCRVEKRYLSESFCEVHRSL
jgi:hypothetical protein